MEKSKTLSKKLISIVLSLLMVLSCFSGMGLTAYAAPTCPNPGCRSTNVEPFLDTWECQDCGYIFNWVSGDDEDDITFTKVTDESQITAENIGTCTAEDAKAWALANWDDLLKDSFFAEIAFYSNTGELYFVQLYSGLQEEDLSTYFDNLVDTASISNLQEWFADGHSVFICTPAAPAEDGPLVGTVIKVGDTLTLDGDYIEYFPGSSDQKTDSFKLVRMEYDDYDNEWGAIFESGAFLIAGDETPEPDGFYVSGGNGTQSHPYTLALHYASAEPATTVSFTKVTDASQITAENIGECTFDDAKAWVLDNWDDIIADAGDVFAVEFAYTVNGNLRTIGFAPNITKVDFQDNITEVSCDINTLLLDYTLGGFPIYLCGFEAPATAYAGYVPAETDDADALAAKVVKFNGMDWYLIEDNSTSETEGTVTLFAKDTIGSSRFNNSNNVYSGSMVKSYLDNLTAEGGAFADVADAIVSTALEDVTVTGAKLWLLSKDEVITTYKLSTALNKCSNDWWLRTPATSSYVIFVNGTSGSVDNVGNSCMNTYGVRPALKLDLSKVEFDSETKTFALPQPLVEYSLWVGGVKVTNKNASNIDGNNKASYDAETNTLTLNGYTNSGTARADIHSGVNNAAIYYNDNMSSPNPLTIQLAEGTTNSLTMTGDRVYGIYVFGSALTITGNGTLNVQSDDMAINDAWGVAITGGTVNAASSEYYGIGRVTIGADISSVTITGKLGAIYGGSNEEQELINAVAGTGWTDVAGTTGQAAIATSTTGQNVSSYKKVYFTPHTHDFTYSANGATITATCTADGCTLTDSRATLTIVAPTLTVYGGTGSAAATLDGLDAFNAATGLNVDADSIVYWKAKIIEGVYKTDGNEPLAGAPTNAGNYLAKITVSNCIASVGYTIAKADPTCTAPTGLTATYGQTLADVTLTNPTGNTEGTWAWADSQTSVGNVVTPAAAFKASFVPTDTTNYNTVTNIDVTVTVGKANITPTVSIEGWTYGETANTPSVTGNAGEGEVTYTYAVKGSDDFSETVPTAVNDYTVKATIAATDNYKAGTATADFTIAKADIAPTVSLDGWTYGEEANQPIVTGNTGKGVVTYLYKEKGASDMSCIEEAPTQAGEYTVKAIIDETDNYNAGSATADFTIAKAKVTITADDKAIMREAALKELTYKVDGKILDGDSLGIKVSSNVKAAVAGKYVIKVAYTENANYDVKVVNGTYTVTDRITANERTKGKNKINSAIKATVNKNGSITAKWGAVANAERFEIYAAYCEKNDSYKKIKTVNGDVTSFNITKLNGKKLNQKKSVKIYVVAYRKVNGKYEKITQSINLHVAGAKTKKSTNAKAITVKKDKFTIKVNKTATIKPTLVLQNSKKKGIEHVAKFRYQSTNTAVATVDANGKITAVGKGTCTIYIFANNGKLKSVKVTVK
jgi:hypothetical protein